MQPLCYFHMGEKRLLSWGGDTVPPSYNSTWMSTDHSCVKNTVGKRRYKEQIPSVCQSELCCTCIPSGNWLINSKRLFFIKLQRGWKQVISNKISQRRGVFPLCADTFSQKPVCSAAFLAHRAACTCITSTASQQVTDRREIHVQVVKSDKLLSPEKVFLIKSRFM